MTQQYTHSITKEAVSELPLEEFTGRIIVIDTLKDTEKAVSYLSEFQAVGFDTETRPSFKKGQRYKISLMQISTDDRYSESSRRISGKRKGAEDRPFATRRFRRDAKAQGHTTRQLPGLAELCRTIRDRRCKPAKDIRHPFQQEDLERTAFEQLGSRRPQRRAEKICSPRRMGLPENIQSIETDINEGV